MNISNLIIRLQELANSSTDAFELMVLAKAIEKAKVGFAILTPVFPNTQLL
jgi:NADH:ubiquinone oxidoreductase subunit K